jgi:hypothetical protein
MLGFFLCKICGSFFWSGGKAIRPPPRLSVSHDLKWRYYAAMVIEMRQVEAGIE